MPMETFQAIMVMFAFGMFILALLTYIDKRK
ncbi:putative holin-like toxin [Gordoniibacillus kamchatkensis]